MRAYKSKQAQGMLGVFRVVWVNVCMCSILLVCMVVYEPLKG